MQLLRILCLVSCTSLAAQQPAHVADFTQQTQWGSPMGLSRRAYLGYPGAANPYDLGVTEWAMQAFGAKLRLWNEDRSQWQPPQPNNLLVADWGGGMGDATLPGPLVAGGPFATTPAKGFGPYTLPLAVDVTFANWSQFENALIYGGPMPAEYPFAGHKTAGVVLKVTNGTAGSTPLVLVAGVRISSSGTRALDIYVHDTATQQFSSLVGGGQVFAVPGAVPVALRVTVSKTRVTSFSWRRPRPTTPSGASGRTRPWALAEPRRSPPADLRQTTECQAMASFRSFARLGSRGSSTPGSTAVGCA